MYSVRQCTKNPAKTKNVYTGISRIDITKIWHPVFSGDPGYNRYIINNKFVYCQYC